MLEKQVEPIQGDVHVASVQNFYVDAVHDIYNVITRKDYVNDYHL